MHGINSVRLMSCCASKFDLIFICATAAKARGPEPKPLLEKRLVEYIKVEYIKALLLEEDIASATRVALARTVW